MKSVTILEAKTHLSKLIAAVEKGETIELRRNKTPVAKLVPIIPMKVRRKFGALKGKISVGPEFFEPLPKAELDRWYK